MTKEEILKKHYVEYMKDRPNGFIPQLDKVYESAADEYAKQECIEFAKWISREQSLVPRIENDITYWYIIIGEQFIKCETEYLYELYLQSKK